MQPLYFPQFNNGGEILLIIVKYMFVLAGFLYMLYAILVTKQVSIMSKTLGTTNSAQNKVLAFVHLVIAILVLIYYLLVL